MSRVDAGDPLGYRVKRDGRMWLAFLRRPATSRPLFYPGRTRHEAISKLLNGVARMARDTPARLWQATSPSAPPWSIARDKVGGVLVSTIDKDGALRMNGGAEITDPLGFEVYRSDTQEAQRFLDQAEALKRHAEIVAELRAGAN